MTERWIRLAAADAVPPGRSLQVTVEGWDLALHNVNGRLYCTSNVCPHQGRPLHTGLLKGTHLTCPWHAWAFDVTTGIGPYNPWARLLCFPAKEEGGEVYVSLPNRVC